MDEVDEILQVLFIGIAMASVLLQTRRFIKAIELFSECLALLKTYSLKLEKYKLNELFALVYDRLFNLYCLVSDYKNAINSGEEALCLCRENGDYGGEAVWLNKMVDVHLFFGEKRKAKESFEKALELFREQRENFEGLLLEANTHEKEIIAGFLHRLGGVSLLRCEHSKANNYLERARAVFKETGNRKKELDLLIHVGNLYKVNEEYKQAKVYYEEALVIAEAVGGTYEKGVAYGKLGTLCNIFGEYAKAKELHRKALEISVRLGDKEGEITDHLNFAKVHINLSEHDRDRECYRKALKISKEIGSQEAEASTCYDLGVFSRSLSDYENADLYLKKSLELYRKIGDMDNEGSAICQLGYFYYLVGRYHEAVECYERTLAISEIIGDRRGAGTAQCDLGTAYQSLGDYDKARKCHQHALTISIETNHVTGQAIDHGNLGTVYQHLGDYEAAFEHHKKAMDIKIRINHKEGLAAEYLNLGVAFQHLGEYVKANEFCQNGLAIAKEIGDRRVEAKIFSRLASIEQTIGEHRRAMEHYEEALQISKEVNDIRLEGTMNGNLGTVYQSLGDLSKAKTYLEKSLAIAKQIGSKDNEGTVLNNLGQLHRSLGEHAEARDCYERSLALSIETGDQKQEVTTNSNLGSLYFFDNKFQKASRYFKRALRISEQIGDVQGKMNSYCHLAVIYMVSGQDLPETVKYLSACIKSLEEMRLLVGESEYYKIALADENAAPYRLIVTVVLKLGHTEMALSISELARARSLAESLAIQYSVEHLPGFNPNRWIEFGNVIQRKSCTGLSFCFVHENLFCWVLKTGKVEVVTNKGLTTDITPQGASIQHWLGTLADQSYRSLVLLQGERCEDRSLFLCDEDAEARSPTHVEKPPTTSQVEENEEEGQKDPPALKDLYNIIIAPVFEFLEGSEIIIVPDRSLNRIPFAALKDKSGEYLSEKFRIRVIPSLTTLKLIQDSPANYHSHKSVLIVGDPDVGTVMYQGKEVKISRLPFAKQETEMIGRLLHVHPLTGKQATNTANDTSENTPCGSNSYCCTR